MQEKRAFFKQKGQKKRQKNDDNPEGVAKKNKKKCIFL